MRFRLSALLFVFVLSLVTGCADKKSVHNGTPVVDARTISEPGFDEATPSNASPVSGVAGELSDPLRGTIKETLDSGGYTYLLVSVDGREVWAAARKLSVAVGDEVELSGLHLMRNFRSQTLGRVFEEIQFVGLAKVIGGSATAESAEAQPPTPALPVGHPPIGGDIPLKGKPNEASKPRVGGIERLAHGVTVAELFAKKADLAGKIVRFRGKVVKASRQILGSNWLHIQDGTGEPGTNDITVTSKKDFAVVGSIVVIEGTLGVAKDFGAGYSYDLIVEDATIVPDRGDMDEKGHAPGTGEEEPAIGANSGGTP